MSINADVEGSGAAAVSPSPIPAQVGTVDEATAAAAATHGVVTVYEQRNPVAAAVESIAQRLQNAADAVQVTIATERSEPSASVARDVADALLRTDQAHDGDAVVRVRIARIAD